MITIKEFAEQQGISQPAVSKLIKKYTEELEGHIIKNNKPYLLDDEAVRILSRKRESISVIHERSEVINKKILEENNNLKTQIIELQNQLLQSKNVITELSVRNKELEFLSYKENKEELKSHVEEEYVRTIFGLYIKKRKNN